jgi:DNA-binding NtrC family response regulator
LFYRVNVLTIDMPSLWERVGDIPLLARHFLNRACAEMGRRVAGFHGDVIRVLQRYSWPGNVRELENVIERAVVLCRGHEIGLEDLPPKLVAAAAESPPAQGYRPMSLREALEEPERRILEAALIANGWNRQLTAEQLDINRTTLYKKMKRYGLDADPARVHTV